MFATGITGSTSGTAGRGSWPSEAKRNRLGPTVTPASYIRADAPQRDRSRGGRRSLPRGDVGKGHRRQIRVQRWADLPVPSRGGGQGLTARANRPGRVAEALRRRAPAPQRSRQALSSGTRDDSYTPGHGGNSD